MGTGIEAKESYSWTQTPGEDEAFTLYPLLRRMGGEGCQSFSKVRSNDTIIYVLK